MLGDVVVPEDPADVVTPVDGVYDTLAAAGLHARVVWAQRDLAVIVADAGT